MMANQAPESFVRAQEKLEQAREEAATADAGLELAKAHLNALQCRKTFVGTQPANEIWDDADPADVITFDLECALLSDHDGTHSEDESPDEQLSDQYLKLREDYRIALKAYEVARRDRDEAEDTLMAQTCRAPGVWCLLWKGHEGQHDEPDELEIVF